MGVVSACVQCSTTHTLNHAQHSCCVSNQKQNLRAGLCASQGRLGSSKLTDSNVSILCHCEHCHTPKLNASALHPACTTSRLKTYDNTYCNMHAAGQCETNKVQVHSMTLVIIEQQSAGMLIADVADTWSGAATTAFRCRRSWRCYIELSSWSGRGTASLLVLSQAQHDILSH